MSTLNRRQFAQVALAAPAIMKSFTTRTQDYAGGLTDVGGILVGHFTDTRRTTGCTVVLAPGGAVAAVDVRGSAPGTRETDLLNPVNTVQKVHAILLSGGSAFGLDAASGVVRYLEEKGIGFAMGNIRVPIVPAAILFDLHVGDGSIRPDREAGYEACRSAGSGPVTEGNVGAGAGATVGKLLGRGRAMKGGLGSAAIRVDDLRVAALVAVNAVGDVVDPSTGRILAGARGEDGKKLEGTAAWLRKQLLRPAGRAGENTTLAVVGTNASFDKTALTKVAQMGHDGLARAINPVHTPFDGDTVFALSTGELDGMNLAQVGALAAEAVAEAVVRAVLSARSIPGYPSHSDLFAG